MAQMRESCKEMNSFIMTKTTDAGIRLTRYVESLKD